jgi:mono/diheme cytochrome c family protein
MVGGVIAGAMALWMVALGGTILLSNWATPRPQAATTPFHAVLAAHQAGPMLEESLAMHGREVFMTTCYRCHGADGSGMPDLGKDLVHSDFVATRDDEAMRAFIAQGRDTNHPLNTTKTPMPARGSDPTLTDEDVGAVVAYLRGMQDPRRMPDLKPWQPDDLALVMAKMKAKAKECAGSEDVDELAQAFEMATGACCDPSTAGCMETTLAKCGFPGTWVMGLACTPMRCVPGACCVLSTGACSLAIYSDCAGVATWVPGVPCAPSPCAAPVRGVCCHADGACTVALRELCPGTYSTDSTTCAAATCPQPTGACCEAGGVCRTATRAGCAGASYRGNGTMCQPSQCESGTGTRKAGL